MRLFAKEGMKELLGRLGMNTGEALHHKMLDNTIENAQKKVEERNFNIRKRLLEYDDVLNNERNFIYAQRDEILKDANLTERVISNTLEIIDALDEEFKDDDKTFMLEFQRIFATTPTDEEIKNKDLLKNNIRESIQAKSDSIPDGIFNAWLRQMYLRNIDKRWVEHLDNLEEIKAAAGLQSYAQKNPLIEYKMAANSAYDEMLESITEAVCRSACTVRITRDNASRQQTQTQKISMSHNAFNPLGRQQESIVASQAQAHNTTVVRSTPKVGRNDPCPCGSGKKYKACCGKNF
jgi:preprotein translocase subunit SecA